MDYIERYFQGEMDATEKRTFEDRCIQDPAFGREVAVYIMMRDQTGQQWKEQKKQEFAALENDTSKHRIITMAGEKPGQGKLRHLNDWRYAAIAAGVVIFIALTFVLYFQPQKPDSLIVKKDNKDQKQQAIDTASTPGTGIDSTKTTDQPKKVPLPDIASNEQLVAMNFEPDKVPTNTEGLLADASHEYAEGNYKDAIAAYNDVVAMLGESDTRSIEDDQEAKERRLILFYAHYYSALSYFAGSNMSKAIAEFKSAGTGPDKFWQNKVRWYLALAYLKTGKVKEARSLLEQVAGDKNSQNYREKAADLLKEMVVDKPSQ